MLVSWLFRILNKRINNFWGTEYFVMPYILLYIETVRICFMNQYLGMIEELIIYDMSRLMVAFINISDYLPIYFINMFGNRVCTS